SVDVAQAEVESVLERFSTSLTGLTNEDALARRAQYGPNVLAKDQRKSIAMLLWRAVLNPLVVLLAILASISFATGDPRAGIMMSLMIAMGVGLKLFQEAKAETAAAKLKALISITAKALRDGQPQD
ncbi:cation-transporting P-type ATPase, partial [Enterobacter hormaechei]|uniref:cation-transporting P-type ATPase n=1 Tax=Enterobacter hormaechei TaxID=158836 RepID=UPI002FCB7437